MNSKSELVTVLLLTLLMAFMEISALPAALFCPIQIQDINPICFALMANFLLAFVICRLCKQFLIKNWSFGFRLDGLLTGLKNHGLPALAATVLVTLSFVIGLAPFENKPSFGKVAIEGVVYYIGVGIMEELYLRGLLQNLLEKCLVKKKHGVLYAILITSVLFGLGHVFSAPGQPVFTIIAKTVWAAALGVYLGSVYIVTRNLWVPILLHFVVNLCGIPFCFSTTSQYPSIARITCLVSYLLLAVYGVYIVKKEKAMAS